MKEFALRQVGVGWGGGEEGRYHSKAAAITGPAYIAVPLLPMDPLHGYREGTYHVELHSP